MDIFTIHLNVLNTMTCHKKIFLFLTVAILVLSHCNNRQNINPISFNLPEKSTLAAKKVFEISEPANGFFINSVKKIPLSRNGNLIVQNYPDYRLYEITPKGSLVNIIGKKGRGPGEFLDIFRVFLAPNDTLHVYDFNNIRHQVLIKDSGGAWQWVREREFRDIQQTKMIEQIPIEVYVKPDGSVMGKFWISPGSSGIDTLTKNYHYVAHVNHNMAHQGEVSRLRPTGDIAILRSGNSTTQVVNIRFWKAFYLYDSKSNKVIYINNDSNEITEIDTLEHEVIKGYLPFERFVPDEKIINEEVDYSKKFASQMKQNASKMERLIQEKLLPHEPFYRNIVLEDQKLWVNLARSDTSKPNWIITNLNGEVLEAFHGPVNISEVTINNGMLYGMMKKTDDISYLVGFEIMDIN